MAGRVLQFVPAALMLYLFVPPVATISVIEKLSHVVSVTTPLVQFAKCMLFKLTLAPSPSSSKITLSNF
jgi:hypothetical protein